MSAFRDDRAALMGRLAHLEEELASVQDDDKRAAMLKELAALSARVEAVTKRVDGERQALAEISESIDRMRKAAGGAEPEPRSAVPDAPKPAVLKPGAGVKIALAIVLVVPVISALVWLGYRGPSDKPSTSAPPDPGAGISGFPHAVDPLAVLPKAHARAGSAMMLSSITARFVSSDGTVDLSNAKYHGEVTYRFGSRKKDTAIDPTVPVGVPQQTFEFSREVTVTLGTSGLTELVNDMGFFGAAPGPDPTCTTRALWEAAIAAGAPRDAVATLEFRPAPSPNWRFTIEGTKYSFLMPEPACKPVGAP